ncbi:hypothetical protein J27TS8_10030 [Robertmurraya siralis]|uniref:DUF3006 domain-containing protein n=1 Tax=Robertmurraya siralis TaxID=77777 RepID=A0A920BSE7_9BACI|nr:DUF3006 domain-containing protein [Robertmurraya siralis]PAE22582.1 hypothetical protein CHH80_01060 [Bacillus sp. 7504-2]GIN61010.1 hypothetical protein J27TS8_10030 [Robertmurraya siralis]
MKAYIDRFEESFAVLLLEESKKQHIKPIDQLPTGASPGMWLTLTLENNEIIKMELDDESTNSAKKSVNHLMAQLRSKKKESKFKK